MALSSCLLQSKPYISHLTPFSISSKSHKPSYSIAPQRRRELTSSSISAYISPSPSLTYKLPPDFTTKQLVNALHQQNDEKAEEIFDQLILEGLQPDNITYNAMLHYFCRAGNIKKAADIVQTMASNGCQPNVVTYNHLIHGLCEVGRIEIACSLLITIQMKGMALTPHAYNPLLQALFKQKKTKAAMRLFREMEEKGDPPNAVTYQTVFRGLCSGRGAIEEAVDFVVEMTGKRLTPEFLTFNKLAEGLCALSMEDTLVMLVERIMKTDFFPENEASMIMGFIKIRKFQDALATLGRILNRRNPKRGR
ncbi:hypothetical protein Vadar_006783 [Vaccinium darrowii]|uniref:Uncharacterized protein n=1 Tax=Vaccinium darrowii TaxID=229202 RepID=A0ACB7XQ37_9ERIC|nr:hypothetical protein Vadar_006783 [Vaccinium darrowii]